MSRNKLKVLVLSDYQGNNANVIGDFLYSFHQYSRHEFFYMHSWKQNFCQRLRRLDLDSFDTILLFWDYFWVGVTNPTSGCYLPEWVIEKINRSRALKVLFLQDEYRDVRQVNHVMARLGVNLMFTCVAERDHELFYPKSLIPSLKATYSVLTGYVPRYLAYAEAPPANSRRVDIGYRSRAVPFYLGSLGHEKVQIAENFRRIGMQYGLTTDISVREEDRIYGSRWLEFLRSSRFSIGTESGASVVDFDGEIRKNTVAYMNANPGASFEDVKQNCFADVDGKAVIQTISPRVFEAAAFGNTLVLHEGEYANIIEPDVHYISVRKDYSNLDDVIARMKDQTFCQGLAERARADLIQSGAYEYRRFVERFDAILDKHRPVPARTSNPSRLLFYVTNYLHQDCIVPVGKSTWVVPYPTRALSCVKGAITVRGLIFCLRLVLNLLAGNKPLCRRVMKWLINPRTAPVTLGGLVRDLRILAILGCVRNGVHQVGQSYDVDIEYDEMNRRLVFRSGTPERHGAERQNDERRLIERFQSSPSIHSIAWDHSEIGDSFLVGRDMNDFVSIFINSDRVYAFDNVHKVLTTQPSEELHALENVLFQPCNRADRPQKAWTLIRLGAALGVYGLIRKPGLKVKTFVKRVVASAKALLT